MKICKKCNKIKRKTEFYHHPTTKDKRMTYCKPCDIKRVTEYKVATKILKKYSDSDKALRRAFQADSIIK